LLKEKVELQVISTESNEETKELKSKIDQQVEELEKLRKDNQVRINVIIRLGSF
jgi:hypothetical protein